MPRTGGIKNFFTFVRGLVTEASPLNFPEGASLDEENFDLNRDGSRQRRLGIDYETDHQFSTAFSNSKARDENISTHLWKSVSEDGNVEFLVVQIGSTLYFHDLTGMESSTGGNVKDFTVNLNDFLIDPANNAGDETVDAASGRGKLFVVNKLIQPFFITYDPDLDTITTEEITVEIRDLTGLDDDLDVDERPAELSPEHQYNLFNQNWDQDNIDTYKSDNDKLYPSNSQVWYLGKDTNDNFNSNRLDRQGFGTTQAAKGSFILNAFTDNKIEVSGVEDIEENPVNTRPQTVEFFAGRVFYALKDKVYFSQLVLDDIHIGRCYQEADPSSEHIFDLVDTDGGIIPIPDAGDIVKLLATNDYILAMSSNGVWVIRGIDGKFTATDQQVNVVTKDVGVESIRNALNVEGNPIFLSQSGIYTIQPSESISGTLAATNITENVIHTEYTSISRDAIVNSDITYDPISRKVYLFYNNDPDFDGSTHKQRYNSALILDLPLNAFYKYTISELDNNSPHIYSSFVLPRINTIVEEEDIVDEFGELVVDEFGEQVVLENIVQQRRPNSLQLLAITSGTPEVQYVFSEFNNTSFVDWEGEDSEGSDYTSFLVTGYVIEQDAMRNKQATYIDCFFNRTETSFVDNGSGGVEFDRPSSCLLQSRWNWTNNSVSGKFGDTQQVYRFRRNFISGDIGDPFDDGYPVVATQNKLRGRGKSLHLKFTSEAGKDMQLLGWAIALTGETVA